MLIDETNWKQELAKLKARRIILQQELGELENKWWHGERSETLADNLSDIENEIDNGLDKAIETIENVFVHKRCYI